MRELFRLMIVLALAMTLAACSDSTKKVVDSDELTNDDAVTDTIVEDTDATGDKDDMFAEGPLSDDSPMAGDEDNILTDNAGNDGIVTDEIVTDEIMPDDDMVGPDFPQPDTDVVVGTCTGGAYHLQSYVYYQQGQNRIVGGGSIAYDPVGANDSEGVPACYQPNTTVNMVVTVDDGYTFDQWRGVNGNEVTGTFPNFAIVMDGDKEARARVTSTVLPDDDMVMPDSDNPIPDFPQPDTDVVAETCASGYKLAPYVYYQQGPQRIVGGGSIALNPTGSNSSAGNPVCYAANATVTMTVTVDANYTFDSWRGTDAADVTGTFPDFSIVVDADKDVRVRVTAN